ncbi:MAG: hypothetical protein JKY65_17150 [Planctomycetes bacterium]|nr:hypothetical protein [Planctomycetota bacterium]
MSDSGGPEALTTAETSTRPQVVILVRARESDAPSDDTKKFKAAAELHAAAANATDVGETRKYTRAPDAAEEAEAEAASKTAELGKEEPGKEETGKEEPGKEEPGKEETGKEEAGKEEAGKEEAAEEVEPSTAKFVLPPELEEDPLDQPTERFSNALRPRKRTAADDVTVGAVIQVDLQADPSPLTPFLGRTLLERAARAAEVAGAPRLLLVGGPEMGEQRAEVVAAAQNGFRGEIEVHEEDPSPDSFGRGRLLLLDGSALQDGAALASMARVSGDKVALLLSDHGDGLRARTEGGAIVEFGTDLQPNDGALAGALACPVEDFKLMSQLGMRAALDRVSREERLVGRVVSETYGRQFRDGSRAAQAERYCYESLAGGKSDGLFDQWFGRHLSRLVTLALLTKEAISPTLVSGFAAVIGGAGGVLLALGRPVWALVAGLLLVVSAILDRTDGELARLRLDDRPRRFDFLLDHAILSFLLAALAWGLDHPPDGVGGWEAAIKLLPDFAVRGLSLGGQPVSATLVGVAGVAGVIALLSISTWRGPPRARATGLERFGDMLASSFGSRDYAYLVLIGGIMTLVQPNLGLMAFVLLGCTALVYGFASLLLVVQLIAPRPEE